MKNKAILLCVLFLCIIISPKVFSYSRILYPEFILATPAEFRPDKDRDMLAIYDEIEYLSRVEPKYFISEGDILTISIENLPELSQEVTVHDNGGIRFPLFKKDVRGLDLEMLAKFLSHHLVDYLHGQKVNVSVDSIGNNSVLLLGNVVSPGVYNLPKNRLLKRMLEKADVNSFDNITRIYFIKVKKNEDSSISMLEIQQRDGKGAVDGISILHDFNIIYIPRSSFSISKSDEKKLLVAIKRIDLVKKM